MMWGYNFDGIIIIIISSSTILLYMCKCPVQQRQRNVFWTISFVWNVLFLIPV